jgi:replicative DNA helicase
MGLEMIVHEFIDCTHFYSLVLFSMEKKTESAYPTLLLEKSILGILIGNINLSFIHIFKLRPQYFKVPKYNLMYEAIIELNRQNLPVDEFLLQNCLMGIAPETNWKQEIKEVLLLNTYQDKLSYFVSQLEDHYFESALQDLSVNLSNTQLSIKDRLNAGLTALFELKDLNVTNHEAPLKNLLEDFVKQGGIVDKEKLLDTPFPLLNQSLCGGFEKEQLIAIGARPGMGKRGLLVTCLLHWVKQKKKVLYISFQQSSVSFLQLLLANYTQTPIQLLSRSEELQKQKVALEEIAKFEEEQLLQFHSPHSSDLTEMLSIIANRQQKHGLDIVIIDSLQMIENTIGKSFITRNSNLGSTLRKLKQLAKDLNVLLLLGSEIGRIAERRFTASGRPMLSDLKDSGYIEEIADKVILIYRPEYYHIGEWEDGELTDGQGELTLAKNNIGPLGSIRVNYSKDCYRFSPYEGFDPIIEFEVPRNRQYEFE